MNLDWAAGQGKEFCYRISLMQYNMCKSEEMVLKKVHELKPTYTEILKANENSAIYMDLLQLIGWERRSAAVILDNMLHTEEEPVHRYGGKDALLTPEYIENLSVLKTCCATKSIFQQHEAVVHLSHHVRKQTPNKQ